MLLSHLHNSVHMMNELLAQEAAATTRTHDAGRQPATRAQPSPVSHTPPHGEPASGAARD